jgi:hypothetical protein
LIGAAGATGGVVGGVVADGGVTTGGGVTAGGGAAGGVVAAGGVAGFAGAAGAHAINTTVNSIAMERHEKINLFLDIL